MFIIRLLITTVLLQSVFTLSTFAADEATPVPAPVPATGSPLDAFKKMSGIWDADLDGDRKSDTVVEYRVISAGSVVAETLFGGTEHEMITIYFMDGPRLLCTHYCAQGNQPRLEATKITDGVTAFTMIDATNLPDRNARHMNGVTFTFTDPNHVTAEWSSMADGKTAEHATFRMSRQNSGNAAPKKAKESAMPQHQSDFVILMYEDDDSWAKLPKDQQDELMKRYMAWVSDLQARGIFKSGSPCGNKQVLLSGSGGKIVTESIAPKKDVLTGFFVVRAANLDEAVALAKTCPSLTHGERIIVRPGTHE